jgi:hypothetical protein
LCILYGYICCYKPLLSVNLFLSSCIGSCYLSPVFVPSLIFLVLFFLSFALSPVYCLLFTVSCSSLMSLDIYFLSFALPPCCLLFLSNVSRHIFPAFCPVSCFLSPFSDLLFPASFSVSCFLFSVSVSCLLFLCNCSCLLFSVSYFLSPVLSPVFCLIFPVSRPVSCFLSHISCLPSCFLSYTHIPGSFTLSLFLLLTFLAHYSISFFYSLSLFHSSLCLPPCPAPLCIFFFPFSDFQILKLHSM